MPDVRRSEILADPLLDVLHLGEIVTGDGLQGHELGEADAETRVVDVVLRNGVVRGDGDGRIDEELEEPIAGKAPSLFVCIGKGF